MTDFFKIELDLLPSFSYGENRITFKPVCNVRKFAEGDTSSFSAMTSLSSELSLSAPEILSSVYCPLTNNHLFPIFLLLTIAGEQNESQQGVCGAILTLLSIGIAACTFPISLFFCIKVVQEYERAVIFRLVSISK